MALTQSELDESMQFTLFYAHAVSGISHESTFFCRIGANQVLISVESSQEVTGQSTSEGSLTVSLPADLLVESSSLQLWQPFPGPQSSSGTMLSHFPAAPSSHFLFFEMNPMLGCPLFAFGSHEGSPGAQAQAQRSTTLGAWPQCHPPAGFAGPFIGPEGIPVRLPSQARWSHIPAPPIHSVLLPVQQHDGILPSQFTRVQPVDTPTGIYWFNDPRLSIAADGNRSISVPKDASPQFLNEPCPVEPTVFRNTDLTAVPRAGTMTTTSKVSIIPYSQ